MDAPESVPAQSESTVANVPPFPTPSDPPAVILAGRYKLVRLLGEGGMGAVYLAAQTDGLQRTVALKLIRADLATAHAAARFEVERQALALMNHPNVARVFDGGVTADGRPFFVMEYVEGRPITDFCQARQLPVRDRLGLFLQVCDAVRHAHQKGIIHRDLKPSNVLVTEGDGAAAVKVIDFGVAKTTAGPLADQAVCTASGVLVGTPLYASPEQARGAVADVDTRTDVYALGVLLYKLLTGTTPIRAEEARSLPLHELLRRVQEEEPEPPSRRVSRDPAETAPPGGPAALSRALRRELDWIVLRAVARERDRRYDSVAALADDVRRHLADQPVSAGPPTVWYRVRKFIRRNRAAVAVVLLLLALGAAAAGGVIRMRQVEQKAAEGEQKAEKAEKEAAATKQDLAVSNELGANWQKVNQWEGARAQFMQIEAWLGETLPRGGKDRVRLAPQDRRRLRRAMLEDVLSRVERTPPIPLEPQLSISLLVEIAVRLTTASAHAEFGSPAAGIPHLQRAVAIGDYLASPDSGLTPEVKPTMGKTTIMFRVQILDLRERAGAESTESLEAEVSALDLALGPTNGIRGERQALAAIRGVLLGRRGEFASGETLLLARHGSLTARPDRELMPGEGTATVRRLAELYNAWGRADKAATWTARLTAEAPEPRR